jgi:HPt (histidine-containing phosphotransfer) domain-containing protein
MNLQQESSDLLDAPALLARFGGDREFLQEIAALALEDCPRLVSEIRSAVSSADAESLQRAAHTLKGCVANFGAEPVRQAAFRLEKLGRSGHLDAAPAACQELEVVMHRFARALGALARGTEG